ncbi:MAG: protein kinase [candidate division Zixibacteria bacterium]|nr:protein kinase [candidate division Zixibacteria bacterium]
MSPADAFENLDPTRIAKPAVTAIARYRVIDKLGAGGMGEVYLAFDPKLQRNVAIKLLPPGLADDLDTRTRFVREAQTAAALNHPNVITIFEIDEHENRYFIAMEYVEGTSLRDLIKHAPLELPQVLDLVQQICAGLAAAHERDIIHRDIKPANILVTAKGRVKILDFGLARYQTVSGLTSTGVRLGTITYMSPEQAQGYEVDNRSDIFSLGVLIFEMLTGKSPFKRDTEVATLLAILQQPAPALNELRPGLPPQWQAILDRCLHKERELRYNSIEALIADVNLLGATTAPPAAVAAATPGAPSRISGIDTSSVTRTALGAKRAIAVLPFENLGTTEHDYFADGITDEVTTSLAKIRSLKVISNNSARHFSAKEKSVAAIAAELGVEYLLTATIRWDNSQSPSRFRLSCKLVDAKDESYLWAESYDRVLDQIFAVQSELAAEVTQALGVALATPELEGLAKTPTQNLEAYDFYLRGAEFFPRSTRSEDITRAITLYEQAVALDPNFALAHVRLALAHSTMYWFFHDRTPARIARAKAAVDEAVRAAPQLPETHLALGYYHYYGRKDYVQALEEFALAGKGRPNDSSLLGAIGFIQRRLGLWNEALRNIRKAAELDPRSALLAAEFGNTLMLMRQYDTAIAQFDRAIWLAPDWVDVYARKAHSLYLRDGDADKAATVFREAQGKINPPEMVIEWSLLDLFVAFCDNDLERAMEALAVDDTELELHFIDKGRLAFRAGRPHEARSYFESARVLLETKLKTNPDDARYLANYGIACAGLGRRDIAIASGQKATALFPYDKDQVFAVVYRETLALIYLMLGEIESAAAELRFLLSVPSYVSKALLLGAVDFAALRHDPSFQQLMRE